MKTKILSAFVVLFCASVALAHSYLDHAEPKVGKAVKGSPKEIRIWFTADLTAGSEIAVFDADGKEVDDKDTKLDESDKTLLSVRVGQLGDGTYTVKWHAVSHDGHQTKGDYTFEVKG